MQQFPDQIERPPSPRPRRKRRRVPAPPPPRKRINWRKIVFYIVPPLAGLLASSLVVSLFSHRYWMRVELWKVQALCYLLPIALCLVVGTVLMFTTRPGKRLRRESYPSLALMLWMATSATSPIAFGVIHDLDHYQTAFMARRQASQSSSTQIKEQVHQSTQSFEQARHDDASLAIIAQSSADPDHVAWFLGAAKIFGADSEFVSKHGLVRLQDEEALRLAATDRAAKGDPVAQAFLAGTTHP